MDLNLPGMSGFEAVVALKKMCEQRGVDLPMFIALTASTEEADRIRSIELGMLERITKPATLASLGAALGRVEPIASTEVVAPTKRVLDDAELLSEETLGQLLDIEKRSGKPFVASLMADYLESLDAEKRVLFDALSRHDQPAVKRAAHALAGASLSLGARALAAALREPNPTDDAQWGEKIEMIAARTRIAMVSWLKSTPRVEN
jgi:CheY-like chemotaxis protein